jgi:hypothetical protein
MYDNPQEALHMAYLAGLFDGEGTFCICRQPSTKSKDGHSNVYHHPKVRIGMSCKDTIKMVHESFKLGSFYDEGVRKDRPTYKIMYRWEVGSRKDCVEVIEKLLPYLKTKKPAAELVLKFCKEWKEAMVRYYRQDSEILQQREDLFQQVKEFNRTGAPATTEYNGDESPSDSLD